MTELMAIESIVEEYFKLKGFFTLSRVPFTYKSPGKKMGHSDIDVLAFKPDAKGDLKVKYVEVKAYGKSDSYSNTKKMVYSIKRFWYNEG